MSEARRGVAELPFICHAFGVTHAIISPGSRSAPLVLAFTAHEKIKCISITDERSAGYYAIGMAQQLNEPVVIVCTSGTAVANYAPALAEAFYLKLPVIAITADRPPEWIDQNDGQTIRQRGLFSNIVKGSYETPVETQNPADLRLFQRMVSEAMNLALDRRNGPVHINVPLREPLYEALPAVKGPSNAILKKELHGMSTAYDDINTTDMKLHLFKKILIVCGMANPDEQFALHLRELSRTGRAIVIAENLTNAGGDFMVETPDSFIASLSENEKKELQPQLLITVGGPVVSKKLKKYLRVYQPDEHWHANSGVELIDTYQCLSRVFDLPAAEFLRLVRKCIGLDDTSYSALAKPVLNRLTQLHKSFMTAVPWSDMAVYHELFKTFPEDSVLHLANSTPVRYSQLFPSREKICYYSNRGTSGIDGCISTAAGAAMVNNNLQIALVGDLAFIYDTNGLWNNHLPKNLRIIVIDNGGGNIFRLIETSPIIEPLRNFFETPHKVKIRKLCEAFSLNYVHISGLDGLREKMKSFFKPKSSAAVMHITTSGDASAEAFKNYYQFISQKK